MKININGQTHHLDVEKAKKAGAIRAPRHVGQLYQDVCKHASSEVYVVTFDNRDARVALTCLDDWETYADGCTVRDVDDITDEEWAIITNGDGDDFVEVFVNEVPKKK